VASYIIVHFDDIDVVECPCDFAQRAFVSLDNLTATLHIVEVTEDSKVHYHKKLTEIYLVLQGDGCIELDGKIVHLKPETAVLIKPGCRHRATGRMRIVNVVIPSYDSQDEWFD
jgi:mannose-6-phosphate isomerase-like protein (cupin superfamily)